MITSVGVQNKPITVIEITGRRDFLERIKGLQETLATQETLQIEEPREFPGNEPIKLYRDSPPILGIAGTVYVKTTRENKENLAEGIIRVVDEEPDNRKKDFGPIKLNRGEGIRHIVATVVHLQSPKLEEDILHFINRFQE